PRTVLVWYDVILTLPTEYSRIWKRRFSGATLIYLVMRYSTVIDGIFAMLKFLLWEITSLALIAQYATAVAAYVILIACTCYKTVGIKKIAVQAGMRTPLTDLLLRDGEY
ncbi:hypothetical protein GY45DRAFT_1246145, partial [Cubamyces sp. BRFM 1775]